jgi:hypothetical protein
MTSTLEGFVRDLPFNEYRGHPGINASLLKGIIRSPAHAVAEQKETRALTDGRALHCAVLEPEKFSEEYVAEPADAPRRPTSAQINAKNPSLATMEAIDWWAAWEQQTQGREVISASSFDRYRYIRDAVWQDADARGLLYLAGFNEASMFGTDPETGQPIKCRFDKLLAEMPFGLDCKFVADASAEAFAKAVNSYGWHVQDAHYDAVHEAVTGQPLDGFAFIAIEKEPPYGVQVYCLDERVRKLARAYRDRLLRTAAECRTTGVWPSYAPGIKTITLPAWGMKQLTEAVEAY